jgi:hypothetical protein
MLPPTPVQNGGPPISGSGATPTPMPTSTPTSSPTFDPASVHISEYAADVTPEYVGAAHDGSVYFGNGGNGSGSNLYRYVNGSVTQTSPAAPPNGFLPGGGVYGITVTSSQVYWLSAYGGPGFAPYVTVECGGAGTASLCGPTVDEPTSIVIDSSGVMWVGGSTFNGGGAIATSSNAGGQFPGGIVQLVLGPSGNVWGVMQNAQNYEIAQFGMSGGTVGITHAYALPAGEAAGSVTYGGDGAFWFTDHQRGAIGRMDTSGNYTEYPLSSSKGLGLPWFGLWQIATACDGSVWFTEPGANAIGRIDGKGAIHEFQVVSGNAYPDAISATSASACTQPKLWVGEQYSRKIAAVAF